jgi:mono/diheme cytochrome c family protein
MKTRTLIGATLALAAGSLLWPGAGIAQQGTQLASTSEPAAGTSAKAAAAAAQPAASKQEDEDALRLEGEKRFHANCGRCHQAPHKLPPRMMATIVRHMRVRATITDEDMRVILHYMTQ